MRTLSVEEIREEVRREVERRFRQAMHGDRDFAEALRIERAQRLLGDTPIQNRVERGLSTR